MLLSHPALEGLPAILETPGPENKGPDAAEIELARTYRRAGMDLRNDL